MIDDNRCYIGLYRCYIGDIVAHQWLISGSSMKKERRKSSTKLINKLPN